MFLPSVLGPIMFISKYLQCSDRSFCIIDFFCAIFSFRVIVDFVFCTVVISVIYRVGFIAKNAVDANLFRLGSSILKHSRSRGATSVGGAFSNAHFKHC